MARLAAICVLALIWTSACSKTIADGKADGPAIFAEACARCHGIGGVPDKMMKAQLDVRDLTDPDLHARLSDAQIYKQVAEGSENRIMPGFSNVLSDGQIKSVVAYVRTLKR